MKMVNIAPSPMSAGADDCLGQKEHQQSMEPYG